MTTRPSPTTLRHRLAAIVGALTIAIPGLLALTPAPASADQFTYPALVNPTANIDPSPNFMTSGPCTSAGNGWTCTNPCILPNMTWIPDGNTAACAAYILSAINNARAALGESTLTLPSNWLSLTVPQQLFTITDMERVSAGYPPYLGIDDTLSAEAQRAALADQDPHLAPGFAVGNNIWGNTGFDGSWAGTDNVLMADYMWMYDDGWSGTGYTSNITCTSPTAWGCWDHRDNLLGSSTDPHGGVGLTCATCVMGTGVDPNGQSTVDLIELPAGAVPALSFTWASEVTYFSAVPAPTTPPVLIPIPAPAIQAAVISFSPSIGMSVNWSVTGATPTLLVVLVYHATGCPTTITLPTHVIKTPLSAGASGTIDLATYPFFPGSGKYSVLVEVGVGNGLLRANCLAASIPAPHVVKHPVKHTVKHPVKHPVKH